MIYSCLFKTWAAHSYPVLVLWEVAGTSEISRCARKLAGYKENIRHYLFFLTVAYEFQICCPFNLKLASKLAAKAVKPVLLSCLNLFVTFIPIHQWTGNARTIVTFCTRAVTHTCRLILSNPSGPFLGCGMNSD